MHTDHDTPSSDVSPEAIKLGHQPDVINARTILYVPIVLTVVFAMTFGIVALIYNYLRDPATGLGRSMDTVAVRRHETPLNERLARIGSRQQDDAVVWQPRLDGLERLEFNGHPPFQMSYQPVETGNSPQYHPEDMRPASEHGKELGLQSFGWKDKEKGIIRIPLADAMKILADGSDDKDAPAEAKKIYQKSLKFEAKVNPSEIQSAKPKSSNPAWGIGPKSEPAKESKGEH